MTLPPTPIPSTLPAVLARDLIRIEPRPLDDPPGYVVMVGAATAGSYATPAAAGGVQDALVAAVAEVVERGVRRAGERSGAAVASAIAERAAALLRGGHEHALDRLLGACGSPRSAGLRVLRYVLEGTGMPLERGEEDDGDPAPVTLERAAGGGVVTAGEE